MTIIDERPRTVLRAEIVSDEPPVAESRPEPVWPRLLGHALIVVALLTAWVLAYLFLLSPFQESRAQKSLYSRLRTELAQGLAPVAEPVATGAPVALLNAPAAGIHDLVVVEGTAPAQLADGPGHLRSSALPGQDGRSILFGRALSYGAVFARVPNLRPGDPISVVTGEGHFVYRVTDARRDGDSVQVPTVNAPATLTLATAAGSGLFGAIAPGDTVYVDAVMTGSPQPRAGTATLPAGDELPMAGDHSFGTLAELVLTLQLFVAVLAALAWGRARWSRTLAHVIGLPLVLASLWMVTDVAVRLLPNLM